MTTITFADVVHPSLSFSLENEAHVLILKLVDCAWVQRLRDISQTANTRLVYMFSEHSRFGHCLGVAYLAGMLMDKLEASDPLSVQKYRNAVSAAALLHDIGHLAPGSHTAYKTWFPNVPDRHEQLAERIIREDKEISSILKGQGEDFIDTVCAILSESPSVPAWTWEIISGGGWNVDRGNWCIVDSVMGGVSYGKYNIPALTESIVITLDGHLALRENRLDAMMHFAVSRHAMYRQMYQHRVLLAADTLNRAVVQRARDLHDDLPFCDETMRIVLDAKSPEHFSLETIFTMRESWWRYHLFRWSSGKDSILADLSSRLLNRVLFKTVRIMEPSEAKGLLSEAQAAVTKCGYDPKYYLHEISTLDMNAGDTDQSMLVLMDNGAVKQLTDAEPLFNSMMKESKTAKKSWLTMPKEAKALLGRIR
ncbi:MAG: HD domain-containing protein [Deltaproteobacteria bacterium]|nr:HD domain-containing protein [Deltaproteobacteria bacterium]